MSGDPANNRARINSPLPQVGQAEIIRALRKPSTESIDHERHMKPLWCLPTECSLKQLLACGAREQIITSDHLGDVAGYVIDDYRELIAWNPIPSQHEEVAALCRHIEAAAPDETVFYRDETLGSDETQCGVSSRAAFRILDRGIASATAA